MSRIINTIFFWRGALVVMALFLYLGSSTYALDVTLQWDANNEPVEGYRVYYKAGSSGDRILVNYDGTGADQGYSPIDVPLNEDENPDQYIVEKTVSNLPDGTYFFVVTAYNSQALESSPSDEVSTDESGGGEGGGGEGGGGGDVGCFITTAAYGSQMGPHPEILSDHLGQTFVAFYTKLSVPIAQLLPHWVSLSLPLLP